MQNTTLSKLIASNIALSPELARELLGALTGRSGLPQQSPYEKAVIRSFRRRGYTDIRPNENIKTFAGWHDGDRIVRAGEKAAKSKFHAPLFHIDQTDPAPITKVEKEALLKGQNYKCETCDDDLAPIASHRLRPDPRGILCPRCSLALRYLDDKPERILKLATYAKSETAATKVQVAAPAPAKRPARRPGRKPAKKTTKAKNKRLH